MPWQATDPGVWQGRDDTAEGPLARRWHQAVRVLDSAAADPAAGSVALLGFASDAGVRRNGGRPGAAEGPTELRRLLANFAWYHDAVCDAGDVRVDGDALETAQAEFGARIATLLAAGARPIGLGGGHEIAWASWQGLAADLATRGSAPRVGILNLDAHLDLRSAPRPHSGTPFRDIALDCERRGWSFQYACFGVAEAANTAALYAEAARLGVWIEHDVDVTPDRLPALLTRLANWVAQRDAVYLTVCLDAFPAAAAPGVSAPAALGIEPRVALAVIHLLRESRRLKLADIAELCPAHDIDRRTARLAARLVWELARD